METFPVNRRLSAILAADVVGYTRLMAQDDAGTLAALNAHRKDSFDPLVTRHNGRIVKLMGDGTLVEFYSIADAVKCAMAIQQALADQPASGPDIKLRIGVTLGDIITQGDDIFGDGVNLATRLEQMAQPGGICISSVVNESVSSRISQPFDDGGTVKVKNVERPLRVFHWHPDRAAGGTRDLPAWPPAAERSENPSIAVLPFDNMSRDPDQEYFSDGISEDIITDLSKVSGLMVIARNSSFAYKGKSVDLRQVGQELNVTHILEGSVRRAGERVRITAQLIETATGGHLWADRFDRDLNDIFAAQDEVTLEIVRALKVKLTPSEKQGISSVGTTDVEAHQNFMRMRGFMMFPGMDAQQWRQAVQFGERAIQRDPNYAQAYAVLSMMHLLDFHNGWSGDDSEMAMEKACNLAEKAYALGPDEILPLQVIAVVSRWRGDLGRARDLIHRLMQRAPDYPLGLFTQGEIFLALGRLPEAVQNLERATRLDPAFRHQILQFLAMAHYLMGNFETAVLMFRERVQLVRDTDVGRAWLAAALGQTGEIEGARETWAELIAINPDFSVHSRLARLRLADPGHVQMMLDGLAKADLPPAP